MELTAVTVKYAFVLMSIGGTAAGLSLGVMQLTDSSPETTTAEVAVGAGGESPPSEPLQVVVDVPVVVPDSALDSPIADLAIDPPETVYEAMEQTSLAVAAPPAAPATAPPAVALAAARPATAASTTSAAKSAPRAKTQVQTKAVKDSSENRAAPTTTTQAPSSTQAPETTASDEGTTYLYYDFPGVASQIVVAQHPGGSLEFWSVTTEPGWSYHVEDDDDDKVEVKFQSASDDNEAEWQLEYEDGGLREKKER